MEELFPGPATFLDDVCALATTGGKGFANIIEEAHKEYEEEVMAELERLQLSRGNPESSRNDVEAADCEELEDAYNLLFNDGEKPVPMKDFTEIQENSSGTKTKTFKNIPEQYSHLEELSKFRFKMTQKQVVAEQSIPQGVMTRSQEEAAAVLKKLALEGELYALQKYQGGMRSAKITYSKDKLLLHRLRKKHPPSGVSVVCHNDVMKLVDPSSRLTFLLLEEKDFTKFGKVFIRLHGDTLAAKQFSCLCTGERGPTYAGFTCVDIFNEKHKTLEYVRMGDYENCNGTGGKPLFPGLNSSQDDYIRPWVAGTIEGCWVWKSEISAQFDILLKDNPGRFCEAAFGIVEEGLKVLKEALLESSCIEMLRISDCGIVLCS